MFAVVQLAGSQFKVEANRFIYVNRLPQDEGQSIEIKEVLLVDNNGAISVGKPYVSGASIRATVLEHLKDDKKIVFKKKRRKGYQVKKGHRQALTKLQIDSINV